MFVEELDLTDLGFEGTIAASTGWPGYYPALLLNIYIYGYLNRLQSSRRLERETQRNVELMWLTGQLSPDFKTIAEFRHDNGKGIRNVCKWFVALCRQLNLFSQAIVAIDGSKFKAVNSRDKNFTPDVCNCGDFFFAHLCPLCSGHKLAQNSLYGMTCSCLARQCASIPTHLLPLKT